MQSHGADEALSILLDPVKRGEAEGIFKKLLAAVREKEGADSPATALISSKLGEIVAFDGRHEEAVDLFWDAIRVSGAKHEVSQQVAIYYRNLGLSLAMLDRRNDAVLAIQSMIGVLELCVDTHHSEVTEARSLLARISKGWKPPLPNAPLPSPARETDSKTIGTEAAEFDHTYSQWEAVYLKSAPDTAQGYLIRLQRLRTDPLSESPYNKLRDISWILGRSLQGRAPEIAGALFNKNPAFVQTYFIQEFLLAPVKKYFPANVGELWSKITFGTLPVRSVNGGALRASAGQYIIVLDTGFFQILSYFFESLFVAEKLRQQGGDADAYTNAVYLFICEYYRDRGHAEFAFPQSSERLNDMEQMITTLRLVCTELFVLCHEIAHVALGHVEDSDSVAVQSRAFEQALMQAGETPLLAYSYNEAKELMADIVGFSLFRSIWFHHPTLTPVADNPDMRELWENEALLVFSLLSLIEKNVPRQVGISSHPLVEKRLEALFNQAAREASAQGYEIKEGKLPPAMDWIRKHAWMARNMPVLKERIAQ